MDRARLLYEVWYALGINQMSKGEGKGVIKIHMFLSLGNGETSGFIRWNRARGMGLRIKIGIFSFEHMLLICPWDIQMVLGWCSDRRDGPGLDTDLGGVSNHSRRGQCCCIYHRSKDDRLLSEDSQGSVSLGYKVPFWTVSPKLNKLKPNHLLII